MYFMLSSINEFIWLYLVLGLLLFTGLLFTVGTGVYQLRRAAHIFRKTLGNRACRSKGNGEISPFQAFATSLAASMGTGNIVGVAVALAAGGAGAVFWMWISAFLGMMTAYAENYLAAGSGSFGYIIRASGSKSVARVFAVFCVLASFGMGNMAQSNSVAGALYSSCGIRPVVTAVFACALCAVVVFGGIGRIGNFAGKLMPALSLVYFAVSMVVIFANCGNLPSVFSGIIRSAFGLDAAVGGACGVAIKKAMSEGLRRGAFSNEAGLGSMPLLNAHSGCPADERGCWAVLEVFADTVFCTLTALVILSSGVGMDASDSAGTVIAAFESVIPNASGAFVAICIALYGFATLTGWCCCGESCVKFLTNGKGIGLYRTVFVILAGAGACFRAEAVWTLSDIFNGLMALPNLLCLLILAGEVLHSGKSEKKGRSAG